MIKAGVYAIRNLENGREYVGKSVDVRGRVAQHFSQLIRGSSPCAALQADFDRDGEAAFQAVLLEKSVNSHAALTAEGFWILKRLENGALYNSVVEIANSRQRAIRYTQQRLHQPKIADRTTDWNRREETINDL